VTTSAASFLPEGEVRIRRKGQIIIQNDVYIGDRVTIMSGVKIGNGAVVGAGSVVSKDIPPYAIAVGNPCKVIKYRFEPDQIEKLQLIRWWDFSIPYLMKHADMFSKNMEVFIDRFYPEAYERKQQLLDISLETTGRLTYLFFPDFNDQFPIWEKVLKSFCTTFTRYDDVTLLIFIQKTCCIQSQLDSLQTIVNGYKEGPDVVAFCEDVFDERRLFMRVDYFITTRNINTVRWSTYADEFNVKVLSGVDMPIFDRL
jgi:virginiamycin A acetyltransferase